MIDCKTLTDQGGREYMEDRVSIESVFQHTIVTVADGHGGQDVAEYLRTRVPRAFSEDDRWVIDLHAPNSSFAKFFYDLFERLDTEIMERFPDTMGSTLCVLVIGFGHIVCANCGDTMAVVGARSWARMVTVEHKASSEVDAIVARGGQVIDLDMPRVNGMLNMSRSMGDAYLKPFIIACPHVSRCETRGVTYVFVATDGVWDVLDARDVHRMLIVQNRKLEFLLGTCRSLGSQDNIAAVLLTLHL